MGETSVYFVPEDETGWIGREREVAEAFWCRGVFLVVPDDFIYDRIREWQEAGRSLPPCAHAFQFASMGLGGLGVWEPVPNGVYDLRCPHCDADMFEAMSEVWARESPVPLPDRSCRCGSCGQIAAAGAVRSDTAFTFARFYLWVSDIGDDWDPSFRLTVAAVLGPCREYTAWET